MDTSDPSHDHGRETQPLLIEKKFKFYEISWEIKNFYVQCCQENWEVCSPEVDGPQETKLILILKRVRNEDGTFSFLVRRSESDFGPEIVWVNFRLNVAGTYIVPKCVEKNKLCSLNKGNECETTFTAMDFLFDNNNVFKSRYFCIECKMIIYIDDENTEFEECTNVGIRSLSEDMLTLFESSRDYDIELKIGGVLLQAHKSILWARCEIINQLIVSCDEDYKFLDLSDFISEVDDDAVKKVVSFLYTGDLKHTLAKPSLFIHELALKFDKQEIKKYYTHETLNFTATVDSQEFTFKWSIQDSNSVLENNKCLLSPVFTDCNSSRTWKLHFCPQGNEDENYVAIFIETNEEIKSNVWLEISAIDEEECLTLINILQCQGDDSKMFGFKEFACRNWLKSLAIGNVLNIDIKLILSTGSQSSEIEDHYFTSISTNYTEPSYNILSFDILKLFTGCKFYNGILQVDDDYLRIHKCILAARCRVLYDMLMSRDQDKHLVIRDIRPDILFIVIIYLYSGSILDIIKVQHKLIEVCKAAKYFNLPLLEKICSKLLLDLGRKVTV